jgi:MFS family permease
MAIVCAVALRDHPDARRPGPVEWRSMLTMPAVSVACVLVLLFGFEYIIFGTFFAAHLRAGGRSAAEAGHLWSGVGLLMMASGVVGGVLSDRIGRFAALAAILGAQALASLALASTVAGPRLWTAVVLYGATVMGVPAILSAIAGDVVGPARASAVIAIINVFFGLGQTIGPIVAGAIIDATGSVRTAFLLGAVVSLVAAAGAAAAAALIPPRRDASLPGG